MDCTEAYKEHIMYSFNGFCKVVIRYAVINAWRDRNRRRQREISFEYLTEEKFYPLSTSDEALKSPYEQYPVTICGQTILHREVNEIQRLYYYGFYYHFSHDCHIPFILFICRLLYCVSILFR